jgi:hypothetical protein
LRLQKRRRRTSAINIPPRSRVDAPLDAVGLRYSKNVKRKRPLPDATATSDAIVPEVILERARRTIELERFKKPEACVICGGECAPTSNEGLCWVCRRLKLSAWRDADVQMPAQE